MKYHLAQYNIACLIAPLDGPRLAPFVAAFTLMQRFPAPIVAAAIQSPS